MFVDMGKLFLRDLEMALVLFGFGSGFMSVVFI